MKDINLLPEDIKSTGSFTPTTKPSSSGISAKAIAIVVVVLLFIGGTLVAPTIYIKSLEVKLASVEKAINDPKYDEVKKVRADIVSVDGIIKSKDSVMNDIDTKAYPINEILISVNSVVPKGCHINSMEYTGTQLKISGNTDDSLAIAELVSKVQRLDFVEIAQDIVVDQTNTFNLVLNVGRKAGK